MRWSRRSALAIGLGVMFLFGCGGGGPAKKDPPAGRVTHRSAVVKRDKKAGVSADHQTDLPGKNGWPMFRGHGRRTGSADVLGPRQPNLKWVFRTQGRIAADATLTDAGDTVLVASFDHHLYAVDSASGREKWNFDAEGKMWGTPAVDDDGAIYVGSDADKLIKLSTDGQVIWQFVTTEEPGPNEKPPAGAFDVDTSVLLAHDGSLVFGAGLKLFSLRAGSGTPKWVFTAGVGRAKIFSSVASSLTGTLFFGTQGDDFFALNQKKDVLWHLETGGDNDASAVVDLVGAVYFGSDDKKVRKVDGAGNLLFEVDLGAPIRGPLGLSQQGVLLAATSEQVPKVVAMDGTTGAIKWQFETGSGEGDFYGIVSGLTTDRAGYVYFGAEDHYVYCLGPNGRLQWRYETGDQVDAGPVLGPDGTLYVGSDDHRLYAFGR